ncbi:MAG: MaoC family dehydratase [Phenylobacterium sp.]|uniref:MaoC family dehydratase n=1 Tax=Phenylobacterium sp. TaxID=1871053 RepID=UPI002735747A|nr:MaoC family dehydratase [Phenylobacterium sp.]MDP3174888.1 MaoC family dehydratase [Phenylobacterium sp.]
MPDDAMTEETNTIAPMGMADMANYIGVPFGPSPWITVTQKMIDEFADATGDHAWFHTDPERAKRELPYGDSIAHGLFTLSLTVKMMGEMVRSKGQGRALNYGYDKVRFLAPVVTGSRIRMRGEVVGAEPKPDGGVVIRMRMTVEIEGGDRPALVMDWMEIGWPA